MMHAPDWLIIERNNQIALAQTSAFGGAVLLNRNNQDGRLKRQAIKSDDPPMNRHVLAGYADVTAPNASVADEPSSHQFGRVSGDGEADTLCRPDHRRVYAHHFAG